ncbi:MAG: asparagine synthase (glutamine-hydrolyzing) [Candidatus Handelsmanbacteria bacterium RIFCSPLOWO2_12_FULL_64_10]|uniref:asparagine synthase (glutamine-hydrolyzing) n=1 Tax=Handelsmanbacteria sp. (strain RIFCSPLOWO2_12_FULL_64_10) TaxID=1817868 RepID=A0A1F6CFZ5_HANXR|nr:MAG: asparagine synthase (glutamine-hydrolyzing) [Candidatus Handelsmanbacteria bacterium RIFCSPLOWO2_12_FULL_64_10]
MCGIAGYWIPGVEDAVTLLRRMCDAIAHRGPDDAGYYAQGEVGLGVRRLSIIDLSTGHQPIANEDRSIWVVFNGEVYNFRELRRDLEARGHRFTTASDTEALLHQYEEDGPACVHRFNGMFAIAIWDGRARRLFLARDRMGVKPLYYSWDGSRLLFASEIKALLASGCVERRLNERALWDYLTFRYVPQPQTIWKGIHKLPPGHTLTLSAGQGEPTLQRYWDIPYVDGPAAQSEAAYAREFEGLFLDSVRLRLIADVPVGILLSGGLDSSAVAAAVAEVHNAPLSSFSVAFKDSPQTDELPFARQVARWVGTEHHEVLIGEREFCDFLPRWVYHADEPLADLASVPLHYVSQLARQEVKVVLSGEGSDEVLGGYHFDRVARRWDWIRRFQGLPAWLRRGCGERIARLMGDRWVERVSRANLPPSEGQRLYPPTMTRLFSSAQKRRLWPDAPALPDSMDGARSELERVRSSDPLHHVLYLYCQSWLVEDLLMKADKVTMANSLELRVPFLDYRLVEWAARAPSWVKVGAVRGRYQTKRVLRMFSEKRLPPAILERSKQGFPVPVYDWLGHRLKGWAEDLLLAPDAQVRRWFDGAAVRRQVRLGTEGRGDAERHRLWDLLIFELWAREWRPE